MEDSKLSRLLSKIRTIKTHLDLIGTDPLLQESYDDEIYQLKRRYGGYLSDLIFEVYDDVCSDCEIQDLEAYLSKEGVLVEADDFPGVQARLKMKINPLRFELVSPDEKIQEIVKTVDMAAA